MKAKRILSISLRVLAALILLQTLYFKFTASPESVYIFSKVGMEPWGRVGTGIAELIASILLLWPATVAIGAGMGIAIMSGALVSHLTVLGITVKDDGGQLFVYAMIVFISCIILLVLHFKDPIVKRLHRFFRSLQPT